jgi:hypothetical protein
MVKQPPKLLSKPDAPVPAATAARPELRKPVAPSATGTREGAIKAPPSAALAAATAAPTSTADDLTSLSTATAAVPASVAPAVATAAATVPGQEELVLRDPDVVRSEALASVRKSGTYFFLCAVGERSCGQWAYRILRYACSWRFFLADPYKPCSSQQGYLEAQGKFEGDDFETLFVRVDTEKVQLQVLIAQGLPVLFDLSTKAFVFEDSADPTSIILDYRGNIVVFKVGHFRSLTMYKAVAVVFFLVQLHSPVIRRRTFTAVYLVLLLLRSYLSDACTSPAIVRDGGHAAGHDEEAAAAGVHGGGPDRRGEEDRRRER